MDYAHHWALPRRADGFTRDPARLRRGADAKVPRFLGCLHTTMARTTLHARNYAGAVHSPRGEAASGSSVLHVRRLARATTPSPAGGKAFPDLATTYKLYPMARRSSRRSCTRARRGKVTSLVPATADVVRWPSRHIAPGKPLLWCGMRPGGFSASTWTPANGVDPLRVDSVPAWKRGWR